MSQQITASNFKELSNGELPLIVDLWAPWCGPCRMVGPIVEELAEQYKGKAVVGKLNVDENSDIAAKFNVSSIPTILMLKNGEEVQRHVGAGSKADFEKKFETWLSQ